MQTKIFIVFLLSVATQLVQSQYVLRSNFNDTSCSVPLYSVYESTLCHQDQYLYNTYYFYLFDNEKITQYYCSDEDCSNCYYTAVLPPVGVCSSNQIVEYVKDVPPIPTYQIGVYQYQNDTCEKNSDFPTYLTVYENGACITNSLTSFYYLCVGGNYVEYSSCGFPNCPVTKCTTPSMLTGNCVDSGFYQETVCGS